MQFHGSLLLFFLNKSSDASEVYVKEFFTKKGFLLLFTEKPTVSREVFENSGILVTDVNNFIENVPKIAAPFKSSYW